MNKKEPNNFAFICDEVQFSTTCSFVTKITNFNNVTLQFGVVTINEPNAALQDARQCLPDIFGKISLPYQWQLSREPGDLRCNT